MRSRLARLGMIAGGLLGLLGVMTPPAQADTVGTVAFLGTATVTGGLAYPCFPQPDPSLANCPDVPQNPLVVTLPLENGPPNVSVTVHGGRTAGFGGNAAVCVNEVVNVNKPNKEPAHVGTCTLNFTGIVNGWCGLSQAQGTANFVDALGQVYILTFHFTGIGGTLVVTGHVRKAGRPAPHFSLVVAVVEAVPVPAPLTLPTLNNSCSNGSAQDFTIAGGAQYVYINDLI